MEAFRHILRPYMEAKHHTRNCFYPGQNRWKTQFSSAGVSVAAGAMQLWVHLRPPQDENATWRRGMKSGPNYSSVKKRPGHDRGNPDSTFVVSRGFSGVDSGISDPTSLEILLLCNSPAAYFSSHQSQLVRSSKLFASSNCGCETGTCERAKWKPANHWLMIAMTGPSPTLNHALTVIKTQTNGSRVHSHLGPIR